MTSTLSLGVAFHRHRDWLGIRLLGEIDKALTAHEQRRFTEAVIRTGVFLEAVSKQILDHWNQPADPSLTLGPLIGLLRRTGLAPSELLERLDEANRIRNRAPHDKPPRLNEITEGDSLQILHIAVRVTGWCGVTFGANVSPAPALVDPVRVFLSVGGPHRLDQHQFLATLQGELRGMGVELVSLSPSEYAPDRPFEQLRELLSSCRAALVIGSERSHAYAVFEREDSERQKVHYNQYLSTAWNQIEASMASALGLPILILHDEVLHREGIFEAANHRHDIRAFRLSEETDGLSDDLRSFVAGWIEHVQAPKQNVIAATNIRS